MSPLPFPEFAREVLGVYSSGKHARKTYLRMRQVLTEFGSLPTVKTTADLTTANVAAYVASKGPTANPNTVNGLLDYLRAAASYAAEEGYLDRSPMWRRVRPRPRASTLNRACSYGEVAKLLAHLRERAATWEGHRLYMLVAFVVLTGVRRDEALYAQIEDVDLAGRKFRVVERQRRLKTAESARTVPLPDALAELLAPWLPHAGTPWLFPGVKRRGPWREGMPGKKPLDELKAAAAAVGIERITWHGLRHTFGTNALAVFKLPMWAVQLIMGHTDFRTTQRYAHLDDPALLVAAARLMRYELN